MAKKNAQKVKIAPPPTDDKAEGDLSLRATSAELYGAKSKTPHPVVVAMLAGDPKHTHTFTVKKLGDLDCVKCGFDDSVHPGYEE